MIRLLLFVNLMYGCLADTVQEIAAKYNGGKRDFETLVGYNAGMSTGTAKRFAEGNFDCPAYVRKSERISSDSPCCWADESWRVGKKNGKAVTNYWGRFRKPNWEACERCDNGNLLSGNCAVCNFETACNYNSVSGAKDVPPNNLTKSMNPQPCIYPSNPCDTCNGRDSNKIKDNDVNDDGICDAQDTVCADPNACNIGKPGPCLYTKNCEICSTTLDDKSYILWNDDDLDGICNDKDDYNSIQDDAACGTKYPNALLCEVCNRTLDDDGDLVCNEDEIRGCMDTDAINYNPDATNNAGCTHPPSGKDIYGDPIYTHSPVYVDGDGSLTVLNKTTPFRCVIHYNEAYKDPNYDKNLPGCDGVCNYDGEWRPVRVKENAVWYNTWQRYKYKYICACNPGYGGDECQYHEKCNYRGEYEETTEDSMYKGGRCYCNRDIVGMRVKYGGTHCEKPATCWGDECYKGTCVFHSDPECKWNSGDGLYWTSKNYWDGFEKLNQQWNNECEFNTCRCDTGWTGTYCTEQTCDKCVHGRCSRTNELSIDVGTLKIKTYDTMCICNWGWGGEHCDKETDPKLFNHGHDGECFDGYSGDQCTECSNCNGQTCHENSEITGYRGGSNDNLFVVDDKRVYDDSKMDAVTDHKCTCYNGKTPISRCYCEKDQCNGHGYCDADTDGHCVCDKGWLGEYCTGQGTCDDGGCTCQLDATVEPNRPDCRAAGCDYEKGTAVFGSDPVMECTECKIGFTNNATEKTNATYADDACDPFKTSPCCNDNACENSLCPENSTCVGWKKHNKDYILCSDRSKTTETSCLAPKGTWSSTCSISHINNQAECVSTSVNTWSNKDGFLLVCSDPQFTDATSCLAEKGVWTSACSIGSIYDEGDCKSTSVNTWDTSKGIALGTYTCGCYPRLTGDNCDIACCERDDPVTNTGFLGAKVNGVCKQTVGGCRCDDGYEGYHCQCSDALCVNGHCNPEVAKEKFVSTVDGAMCICYPGWEINPVTGVCDVDINECDINVTPCEHGVCEDGPCVYGTCLDGPGSFECKCNVGYIGDRCQTSTGWRTGATTCEGNKYLVEERCLDCPVGTYSNDPSDTECRVKLNDLNIRDAVNSTSHEYYGDIEDFDTSEVTNMDELFMNRVVPNISKWDVSAVTSMRNMFAGSTGTFDRTNWNLDDGKDITNIYAGSDMQHDEGKEWIQAYAQCNGTNIICMHNGLLCVSGKIVDDTCKVDNQALRTMVGEWEANATKSDVLYGPLKDWDVHYVTDMTNLFRSGNPDIRQWDMSNVVHADGMLNVSGFNYSVDNKDFSSLQTARLMFPQNYGENGHRKCGKHFARARANVPQNQLFGEHGKCLTSSGNNDIRIAIEDWYNETKKSEVVSDYGDMPDWDVSEVINMMDLFKNRTNIPSLAKWDTGKVTSMEGMFQESDFNEDIRHWDVRKVTTFANMFMNNIHFAVDLTSWELHIGDTTEMFMGNDYYFTGTTAFNIDKTLPTPLDDSSFDTAIAEWFGTDAERASTLDTYGNISDWLTFKVTDMSKAFQGKEFNGDISRWVVSSVTDMSSMFEGSTFNGDISTWEVVNVENMQKMFKGSPFNQMIDRWNVSSVTDMTYMFQDTNFSRPIDSWDLFGTEPLEARAPGGPTYCIKTEGKVVDVVGLVGRAARRKCFDECTNVYPLFLPDIEGRNRNRSGGRVGGAYTPYLGGFGEVTNQNYNHTCMCIDKKADCGTEYDPVPPFDYVYEYLDLNTTGMFVNNEAFVQPLCGLGWRYRDLDSLSDHQKQVSFTCDICAKGQHMSKCGLCMGEFRFDKCMDSTRGYTLSELHKINPNLLVDNGIVLNSDSAITATTKVNPYACNCKYEGDLRGCLLVNGRKQVRVKEWYVWGEEDFSAHIDDNTEYYCEVDFLDGREVATAKGFNSVTCTEDTMLNREECGLVGGNWDGQCDKCLEPCDPPELGVKFFSENRECKVCDAGKTVFQNECVFCPDGQFTSEDYAYCGKCPMGTFGEGGDCRTCDYGKASTFEGAVRCDTCPNEHYSTGTSCEDCLTGKTSEAGDRICVDKAHCWRGNTTEDLGVGNYCSACEEGFELVANTCVSLCKGELVKEGETDLLVCKRAGDGGKWSGDYKDECEPKYDFRYMGLCADRPCDATMVTDCLCIGSGTIVKDNKACDRDSVVDMCYDSVISNCLCDMGGEYKWVSEGSCWGFCSSPDIIVESECESTPVNTWTGGCSDPSLKTEEACLVMGSMVQTCSNGAAIADCGNTSNIWDDNTGCSDPQYTDNVNCTANIGEISEECDIPDIYILEECVTTIKNTWNGLCSDARYLSQATCLEEKHVWGDRRILDDCPRDIVPGQPCTDSSIQDACTDGVNAAAKCAGFQCTADDFVDGGACCSAETPEVTECILDGVYVNLTTHMIYSSSIYPKCGGTTLENCYASPWTMHDVLIDCHGHNCPLNQHVVGDNHCVGFGCDFDASCCDWNQQCSDRSCSDRGGYRVADINPDTYASTAVFSDEFEDTCCDYDQMCNSTEFSCTYLADDFCDGNCTQTDFQPTEESKSTCCTDASWYCESGTCPEGWLVNTEYCGEKCSDDFYAVTFTEELNQRTSSLCCDVDTDKDVCAMYDCPLRYKYVEGYKTKVFETHASECCVYIPHTHFCDIFNSGIPYVCPNEHKYNPSALYCGKECDETTCCTPNNHFCDSITCNATSEASTVVDYCGGDCTKQKCCVSKPVCDRSHDCGDNADIDWEWYCDVADEDGVCASSEYELGKCCKSSLYCYADDRYDQSESVNVTRVSWDTPTHMGNPMPGCNEKEGYISYYENYGRTGGSFTVESFEAVCCKYVETCLSAHACADGTFPKGNYITNVAQYCASGSSSDWGRIEQCDDSSNADKCCEEETCETAQSRLGTQCHSRNLDVWSDVQTEQLTRSEFFETCCKPECGQLQYETEEGDRGYDLCHNPDGSGSLDTSVSTVGDLNNKTWVVNNCCEDSCGKQATLNGYACLSGSSKDPGFWTEFTFRNIVNSNVYSSDITSNATFQSKCCYTSCDSLNGTGSNTCGDGKVENIQKSEIDDPYSTWNRIRSVPSNFESTCCVDATCDLIFNSDSEHFRASDKTCEDVYGVTSRVNTYEIFPTDYSDPYQCCDMESRCVEGIVAGFTCPNGTNIAPYVGSWITVNTDTLANFQDSCCIWRCPSVVPDCGDLFPARLYHEGYTKAFSDFDNPESVCCDSEWQCDVMTHYKGWDNIYTDRNVGGTTYQQAFVEAYSVYNGNLWAHSSSYLKYDVDVTESEWIEKCMCPSGDLECLKHEMIAQGLIKTCEETGYDCYDICEKSYENTNCEFTNIAEFSTKLWAFTLDVNRFMELCCLNSNDVGWIRDYYAVWFTCASASRTCPTGSILDTDKSGDVIHQDDFSSKCCVSSCEIASVYTCPVGYEPNDLIWTQVNTFTDQDDFSSKCCVSSCEIANSAYTCPVGSDPNVSIWTQVNLFTDQDDYSSKCCVSSCEQVNGTFYTCPDGSIPITSWTQNNIIIDQDDFSSKCCIVSSTCAEMSATNSCPTISIESSEPDKWSEDRYFVGDDDFTSVCCMASTCTNHLAIKGCRDRFVGNIRPLSSAASSIVPAPYDDTSVSMCCEISARCLSFVQAGKSCSDGEEYTSKYDDYNSGSFSGTGLTVVTESNFDVQCCRKNCASVLSCSDPTPYPADVYATQPNARTVAKADIDVCHCDVKWTCRSMAWANGWNTDMSDSYTLDDVVYKPPYAIDRWSSQSPQWMLLEYNTSVSSRDDWLDKCWCPEDDRGSEADPHSVHSCLTGEMLDQGLLLNCADMSSVHQITCKTGNDDAGREGFDVNDVDRYDNILIASYLETSTSQQDGKNMAGKNEFMKRCCNNGGSWEYYQGSNWNRVDGITNP